MNEVLWGALLVSLFLIPFARSGVDLAIAGCTALVAGLLLLGTVL